MPELWLGTANWHGGFCPRPTPTPAGDKPLASRSLRPRYIFSFRHRPSVYNSARFAGGEPASRLIGEHIPDRSPGHAFVPMTNLGAGMTDERVLELPIVVPIIKNTTVEICLSDASAKHRGLVMSRRS